MIRLPHTLRWCGLVGIATIASLRCLVVFAPQIAFDVDPVLDGTPLGGLAMGGSLLLDALLICACALALLGEHLSGRRLSVLACVLGLVPFPIIFWHGISDAGDLWRGSTWAAGALTCVTVAHLARERAMRIVLLAVLAAVFVPICARGFAQITYENADTIREFERNKESILQQRGWTADSAAARIFERRLRSPEPFGWFTTSNIFASCAAFSLVLFAGLALACRRARLESGWWFLMALCALVAAVALGTTGSKGAMLAALAGVGLLLVPSLVPRLADVFASRSGLILLALIGCALLGVIVRGVALPESFAHEKSLLFRWHYTIASAPMFSANAITGVGPDGYQAAYTQFRVERNPEEVISAHSMFWDWLCALGIVGAAWIALVVHQILRSGLPRRIPPPAPPPLTISLRPILLITLLAGAASFLIELPTIESALDRAVRGLGIAGFAAMGCLLACAMQRADDRMVRWSIIAAIAVLLMHSQIEMTFHQPGSVVWAFAWLGLLAPMFDAERRTSHGLALTVIVAVLAGAGFITLAGVAPAFEQESHITAAARGLHGLGEQHAAADIPHVLQQRRLAAARLIEAYEIWPANVFPLEAAADQLQRACSIPNGPQPLELLHQAGEILARAMAEHARPSSIAQAVSVHAQLGAITGDAEHWQRAITLTRRMTELDPHGLGAWRRLGDVLWLSGDYAEAANAYRVALQCDANFELDELKRLSEGDRRIIEERIAKSEAGSPR